MTRYFLQSTEFNAMGMGETNGVTIYAERYANSISRYDSETVKKVNSYEFEYEGKKYSLKSNEVEVTKITHRKPHSAVREKWDKQGEQVKQVIKERESTLENYVKEDLKGIRTNLFVDSNYANVVETKIDELRKTLSALELRLGKLKHTYDSAQETGEEVKERILG